jgi:hypothetical protein
MGPRRPTALAPAARPRPRGHPQPGARPEPRLHPHGGLHARDSQPGGFQWLVVDDEQQSVLAFARIGLHPADTVVVVANLTPVVRHGYRLGCPARAPTRPAQR